MQQIYNFSHENGTVIKMRIFIFLSNRILIDFMTGSSLKYKVLTGFAVLVLFMQACITDEFRFKDLKIDENWEIGIVTPLFSGDLEFRDFIHNWFLDIPDNPPPFVFLDYEPNPDIKIPTQLIFDRSTVIDSFPFHIKGKYEFTEIDLVFTVKNSAPFPLNLRLYFFQKNQSSGSTPEISPSPFKEANFGPIPVLPVTTADTVSLSASQLTYFINGDRFRMDSWFDKNDFIINNDTLSAHYPINVSITLVGKVKVKQDE